TADTRCFVHAQPRRPRHAPHYFCPRLPDLGSPIQAIPNSLRPCSTSADELSWASPDFGPTGFCPFLGEILRGSMPADEDGDHRIDAREIWKFTRESVSQWAQINRLAEQTPMLLPSGAEGERRASRILVSLVDRKYHPSSPDEQSESPSPLKVAWAKW